MSVGRFVLLYLWDETNKIHEGPYPAWIKLELHNGDVVVNFLEKLQGPTNECSARLLWTGPLLSNTACVVIPPPI